MERLTASRSGSRRAQFKRKVVDSLSLKNSMASISSRLPRAGLPSPSFRTTLHRVLLRDDSMSKIHSRGKRPCREQDLKGFVEALRARVCRDRGLGW